MRFSLISLLIGVAVASPAAKPPTCSQIKNNCAPKVSTYCSSYLNIKPTTTTTTVSSGVATTTSTFIAGTMTVTSQVSTCTLPSNNKLKRAAAASKAPSCLKANSAAATSSACSCLATSSTVTHTSTVATSTTTTVTTVQVTKTFTSLVNPPCPTVTQLGTSYHDKISACGVEENGSNPGGAQVFVSHYPGSLAPCAAINSCASAAASKTTTLGVVPTIVANSIDVHYLFSPGQWECVAYQKTNNDPSDYNIFNDNVGAAYGYTI